LPEVNHSLNQRYRIESAKNVLQEKENIKNYSQDVANIVSTRHQQPGEQSALLQKHKQIAKNNYYPSKQYPVGRKKGGYRNGQENKERNPLDDFKPQSNYQKHRPGVNDLVQQISLDNPTVNRGGRAIPIKLTSEAGSPVSNAKNYLQ
jgi:hypothetical protein